MEQAQITILEVPQAEVPHVHRQTLGRTAVVNANVLAGFRVDELERQQEAVKERWRAIESIALGYSAETMDGPTVKVPVKSITAYHNGEILEAKRTLATDPDRVAYYLSGELEGVRKRLQSLAPYQQDILQEYCNMSPLHFLKKAKNRSSGSGDIPLWAPWLASQANDEQLINFLQWHVHSLEQQQANPEALAAIEEQRQQYKQSIAVAVEQGWLREDATAAIDEVDDIEVYIGDVFDTLMQEYGGYHVRGSSEIVIAGAIYPSFRSTTMHKLLSNISKVTKHEFNHATLGWLNQRWLNEALTEHIAQSLDDGEWHITNPDERQNEDRRTVYAAERRLLDAILNRGRYPVPVQWATQAYSERDPSIGARVQFDYALDEAWDCLALPEGLGLLQYLNIHVSGRERRYQTWGFTKMRAGTLAATHALENLMQRPELIFS